MAGYFSKALFDFLKDLAAHNDRTWFAANAGRLSVTTSVEQVATRYRQVVESE